MPFHAVGTGGGLGSRAGSPSRAVTGDLLGPCTAEGVPPRVAHIVRSSLESVGWDVSQNCALLGATPPTPEGVAEMLGTALRTVIGARKSAAGYDLTRMFVGAV